MPYVNEQQSHFFHGKLVKLKQEMNYKQALYDELNRRKDHPDSLAFDMEDGELDLVMVGDSVRTKYNESGVVQELHPDADKVSVLFEDGSIEVIRCDRITQLTYQSMA
jgi:hypothetical protein